MECAMLVGDQEVSTVDAPAAEAACGTVPLVWIHLDAARPESLAWLRAQPRLPESVATALTAVETRPRTELFGEGALVNLRGLGVEEADGGDPLVSVRIWAERGRVLSVGFRPMRAMATVRERVADGRVRDPGDFITAVAVAITETLDPDVAALGDLVDDCEEALAPGAGFDTRRTIGQARSKAIGYRRFVAPQRQALERAAGLEVDWLEETDRLHLRGAADRFARMAEELEAVRERAALLHEQLTDLRSEQIEIRGLIVSVVALVFLPLTFLTGLLGMNVAGIPHAADPNAFWEVCAVCALVAAAVTGGFAGARWFNR